MKKMYLVSISIIVVSSLYLSGCSVMRAVGGSLTEYGNSNEGIIGDAAEVAGSVYTTVGCMGAASEEKECDERKN